MKGAIALGISAALLAGCSGGNKPSPRALKQIDHALATAPGKAQPSKIVKVDLAFNRSAREDGLWTAFGKFAAPDAVIHTPSGIVSVAEFIRGRKDPKQSVQWEPKAVWMSCDGSTAVSQGRLTDAAGKVGTYITVWERQGSGRTAARGEEEYRFVYDTMAFDNPQPPAPEPLPAPRPGDIVVEALDAVKADIARCAPAADIYLNALAEPASGVQVGSSHSRDKTLQWNWAHIPGGARRLSVSLWRKDGREIALTQSLPSAPK